MKDQERTPLRTILLNFLNHIENLEAHRSPEDSYETEFQELKLFSETLKTLKQYSCSEGEKEVNRKKNRYKDILPFDLSRVILNEYAGIPGSDYINANYIKGASGSPAYIASQGPLPHTVNDFWRMVVQCEVQVIVMACNEEEAGKHKCENYWVEGEGEEKQFGMVTIRLIKASTVCPDFSVRTMRLKYTNTNSSTEERTVCQFHYSAWPDHGVPPLVRPLLDMVRLVRDTQASETLPVLVHCSAGCGRTGTICAIDYVWGLLRAGKLTKDFSLLSLVREMRKQRIAMVQTKEQYVLVHRAVRELFKEQLRMIDSHPYENIDYNGMPLDSEPTYDTIETNINSTEEKTKKDDKEKEVTVSAPPLPQKKRFPVPSSKREKEAENLSEKLRIAEQAESHIESPVIGIGHRPRIAKLKSLFERETKQVSRSHSLGAPRKTHVVKKEARPTPSHEVLSVPQLPEQYPALPVKRSKSLRVLGSSDRYRLSVVTGPTPLVDEKSRRLSLESNMDVCEKDNLQEGGKYFSGTGADSVIAGLAVRERRNSFREAVSKTELDYENLPRKPGAGSLVRSYTAIDIRPSVRHNFEVKTDYNKPVLQPKPLTKPALSCHRLNIVRPPVSVNEVWPSEKQKKSIVPKSEYSNSQNSLVALRKYKLNATVSCCRPSPPPPPPPPPPPVHSGSVMKELPKKEKKILQSSPQVNDRGVQQFVLPSSKLQLDACGSNVSKQEGGYSQTPDTVHVWRKQLQCASDKRVSNKTMKSVRLHALPKTNHSYRGQIQMLRSNVVDFDKDMLLVPSYNESLARYNCKTNVQQQLNTSQNQTPVRLHNSRNVIYDSKFSQDCHKYPASSRHMQGKDLVMNERQLCHGHQKPKQFYQENNLHQATIYSDCHPESSSKLMGRQLSVVEGTQSSHKNPLSPQVGQRKNSADVLDDKQVNHFDDSKVNSSSVGRSINMNDCRYYSKSSNNELKVMSDSELVACKDGTARVNMSVSSPDQYRSPPLYSVPGQQTSDNISRSQLAHTNGPEFTGYGGMKPRRGSQDDLALCTAGGPVTPSRVKRHASVVVLRHSFIESSDGSRPLAVWNSPQVNGDIRGSATQNPHFSKESEDPWSGAVGVDLDEVAASMTSQKDGSSSKLMKAALQALHQRKGVNAAGEYNKTPENVTGSSGAQQHSGTSMKNISTTSPVQSPPFRKQQQYL